MELIFQCYLKCLVEIEVNESGDRGAIVGRCESREKTLESFGVIVLFKHLIELNLFLSTLAFNIHCIYVIEHAFLKEYGK